MRSRYVIVVTAILVAGFAIKWLFFTSQPAEAQRETGSRPAMDVLKMQGDSKDLPVLDIKDPI